MVEQTLTNLYNPDVLNCLANLSNDEVFTPPSVVNEMLDLLPISLWSDPNAKFLDPSVKSGVFLREIAKRLLVGLEQEIPDLQQRIDLIFQKQLYGIAITELTSLLSRRSLYCSKYPNGRYSITSFKNADGNILFRRIEHCWRNGRCAFCGASRSEYDRSPELESHAYGFIHTRHPEELLNMKFDVIIGNPPYQLSDGGAGASAKPIYQHFVIQAKKMKPRFLVMITPSRWFAGGKGLDSFRDEMIRDKQIRKIVDYANAKECFPESSIGGGVNYFLWELDSFGDCEITNIDGSKKSIVTRPLDEFPFFVRTNNAISIIHKVQNHNEESVSSVVSSRNTFGFPSSTRGEASPKPDYVRLFSSEGASYLPEMDVANGREFVHLNKVMMSKLISEHAGEPDKSGMFRVLSRTQLLAPGDVCTDSYLIAYPNPDKSKVQNFLNYLRTRFSRFLLLQAVTSINLSREKFSLVPLQDFSKSWTDEELYLKYELNEDEITFIESMIRPMDLSIGDDANE